MAKSIKLMGCIALFVVVALSSCSSKKYDSWSECISAESQKSDNGAVTRVYCDSNYDMTDREREVRHNVYCSDILNKAEPECNPTVPQSGASTSAVTGSAGDVAKDDISAERMPLVTMFAGKLPWEAVNGYSFTTHPKVVSALKKSVGDKDIVKYILSQDVVGNPISEPSGSSGVMVYQACEPQNCGDNNWRILYYSSSGDAEVCISNKDKPYSFRGWMPSMEPLSDDQDCLE
jgi:hypothetical protein